MTARRWLLVVIVLALIGGGAVLALDRSSSGEDIYLEGAGQTGDHPFTTIAVRDCADGFEADQASGECVPTTTSIVGAGTTTTTALYGGSGDQKHCDPQALIAYLTSHPDKAKAWVAAQNEDPSLTWSGGNKITVADIPTFILELTPTFLTEDTRVTNHGYVKGKATPHQSVLQKGTAVLVDRNGVPRARCACGNPLGRPHKVRDPHYKGHCWDGCHDRPYCAPPGCSETTTSTSPTTSTTECGQQPSGPSALKQAQVPPVTRGTLELEDPCTSTTAGKSTTTTKKKTVVTTTTHPPTTTTVPSTTTTRRQGTTSSSSTTSSSVVGKP